MTIREYVNKHPGLIASALILCIGCVAFYAMMSIKQTSADTEQSKSYFTTDDGATYFADAYDKPSGFLKDGKPAYAVNVYERDSGKPFVGFIRKAGTVAPSAENPPAETAAKSLPQIKSNSPIFSAVDKDAFLKSSASAAKQKAPAPAAAAGRVDPNTVESLVKKPGEKDWHSLNSPEGKKIIQEFGPAAQSQGLRVVTP